MTSTSTLGFAQAAKSLGVSIRTLRRAIHDGKVPAPAGGVSATSALDAGWLNSVRRTASTTPGVFKHRDKQHVAAFARYEGTSAWRKYRRRVREYNAARAAA